MSRYSGYGNDDYDSRPPRAGGRGRGYGPPAYSRNGYDSHNNGDGYGRGSSYGHSHGHSQHGNGRGFGRGRIFTPRPGTEEDRVNCPFYFKIGTCRHGDRCSRAHNEPASSKTIIIPQLYENPLVTEIANNSNSSKDKPELDHGAVAGYSEQPSDEDFEDFYVDVFEEVSSFGEVEDVVVCGNLCDHLVGNVYVKFYDEQDAASCQKAINGRFYAGRQIRCDLSPVSDFREARCRQYFDSQCDRSGDCNFIHPKKVTEKLLNQLKVRQIHFGEKSHLTPQAFGEELMNSNTVDQNEVVNVTITEERDVAVN